MTNRSNLRPVIIFPVALLVALIALNMNVPFDAQAGPLAGFTPTPASPGGGGGDGGGSNGKDKDSDTTPTDFVIVQIESCDLSCSAGEKPGFVPLASLDNEIFSTAALASLSPPDPAGELLAQVHLIHDGSGWIAAGVLSNRQSTRFNVPYPGRWEVFLAGRPELVSAEAVDDPVLAAALTNSYSGAPELLGVVEANILEPQFVKCPLNCVIEPIVPLPLPETGADAADELSLPVALLVSGLSVAVVGLTFLLIIRLTFTDKN